MLGTSYLTPDAVLVSLELVKLDRVGVVSVFVLLACLFQPGDERFLTGDLCFTVGVLAREGFNYHLTKRVNPIPRNPDVRPVSANFFLDQADWHIALRATGLVLLPTEAVEVRVAGAKAVLRHNDAEPPPAHGAEQVALQVMRTLTGFILVLVTRGQQGIHAVKRRLVNERRMLTLVFDTVVRDPSGVIAVVQNSVHGLDVKRTLGQILISRHPQTKIIQFIGHVAQRVNAGVVQPKTVGDEWPGYLIDNHNTDVLAVAGIAGIGVADRHFAGRTAKLDLLTQSFFGFLAQVRRVPFGNVAHDAVYEFARW